MKIKAGKEQDWEKAVAINDDFYGKATVDYARRWAQMMEKRMGEGRTIAECAELTSHAADTEGISGLMYGCAVWLLAQVWEHGEALRLWHNLKSQIGNEGEEANESGGVLNPALLYIGEKK